MDCKVILGASGVVFNEYANMIKYSLQEMGHKAEILEANRDGVPPNEGDLNIVTKAFRPYKQLRKGGIQVLYQSEEL
jgi:hypothetical protein